nr:hypothetical protein [Tanacetum cinerariifolium]
MDLKWQLALLSMRAKRFFQKTGKKITINRGDIAGFDTSKVECYNCHKMGHSARECRGPRNQNSRNMYQDSSRRTMHVEETPPKAMVVIDGVSFDWSFMEDDEVPTNMALMYFLDTEFNLATYKRGLAYVEEQLVFYKKNEVLFCEQIAVLKRDISYKDSEINLLIRLFLPPKLDLSNSSLEEFKQPQLESYEPKSSEIESTNAIEDIPNDLKECPDAPLVKDRVSDNKDCSVASLVVVEKKNDVPTIAKVEVVRPKQQEKPIRKIVRYAEMYRSQGLRGNQRNWNNQKSQQLGSNFLMYNKACFVCGSFKHVQANYNYHHRERVVSENNYTMVTYNNSTRKSHPSAHRNMAPRAVFIKTRLRPLNIARLVNTAYPKTTVYSAKPMPRAVNTARPRVVNTARPNSVVVNAVGVNQGHPQKVQEDQGYVDSGCFRHMTGNMSYLSDFKEFDGGYVTFGGGANSDRITGKGNLKTGKRDFEDMYFLKELKYKILSVSQMCDIKNSVLFTDTRCFVLSPDFKLAYESQVLLKVPKKNNMYSVDMKNIVPKESLTCLVAKATLDESMLWHRRLGHINFKNINKLVKNKLVRVSKNETTCILKKFIIEIENLVDKKVNVIRCDNGTEFKNSVMNDFCAMKGIRREFSVAKTPQQNGVAERRNRTLIEAARTMLADSKLPTTFLAKAVNTACYVQNKALVVKPHNKTPYELFRGRTPSLSFMRPFGCHVTILNTLDHLGKFDRKADNGYFVRYSMNSKAFRVYNIITRRVEENLHIEFLENKPIVAGIKDSIGAGQSSMETGSTQDCIFMPLWKDGSPLFDSSLKLSDDAGSLSFGDDGKKHDGVLDKESRASNELNSTFENLNTEYPDDLKMLGLETIATYDDSEEEADFTNLESLIHVFKNKKDERGIVIKNKSSLVAQGHTQEEGIDYDEVFALVARIKAIRLFLSYASFMGFMVYQMDMKSAFLYRRIKEEDKSVTKVLKKFSFLDVKSSSTPMDMEKTLVKDADGDDYVYVPDFNSHLRDSPFELVAYTDSDYAGAILDRKSTIRGCQFLGSRLISWQYKKQSVLVRKRNERSGELKNRKRDVIKNRESVLVRKRNERSGELKNRKRDVCFTTGKLLKIELELTLSVLSKLTTAIDVNVVEDEQIQALVDKKKVIITETSVRSDIYLEDTEGTECLPTAIIFEQLTLMGAKTTAWHEFSTTMASAIMCLATNQKFNFSKYIFDHMVKNLEDEGKDFSGKVTPLFETIMVQLKKTWKQKSKKSKKKITKVPQLSDSTNNVTNEHVNTTSNDPLLNDEDRLKLTELMELCTKLQSRVLALETTKANQALEIESLNRRVKKLEKKGSKKTHKLKRLYKIGVTLVDETQGRNDQDMLDTIILDDEKVVVEKEVSIVDLVPTASEVVTTAGQSETPTPAPIDSSQQPLKAKDNGKAKMIEPEKPLKRKDQIMIDEEVTRNLEAHMQAELEEEERLVRQKEEEASIAIIESWDNTQAMTDADYEQAARLQEEERRELNIEEKSSLFVKLMDKRNIYFARLRVEKIRKLVKGSEKAVEGNEKAAECSSKRAGGKLEQEDAKRQRIEEENGSTQLKRCLEIILDNDDDVTIEATPLSSKSPTIVDYKIYKEGRKSFFRIIRADVPEITTATTQTLFSSQNNQVDNYVLNPIRIIPSPAGIVQTAKLCKLVDTREGREESVMSTQDVIDYVNVDGGIVTGCFGEVKNFLKNEKLNKVVAIINSCTPNALGDLTVTLKDLSGTISGTIHYKVLTEERFAKANTVGAVDTF